MTQDFTLNASPEFTLIRVRAIPPGLNNLRAKRKSISPAACLAAAYAGYRQSFARFVPPAGL